MAPSRLVILYGMGGLSDVGRHAILAALEQPSIEQIKVFTRYPALLNEPNWNCGCPEKPHTNPSSDPKVQIVPIEEDWSTANTQRLLREHIDESAAIISCLGNRQPSFGHWESEQGNKALLEVLAKQQSQDDTATTTARRVVVITSAGVEEDWPPIEFVWYARAALSFMFVMPGLSRGAFRDLTQMERAYRSTSDEQVDFLLVRPVGLGEEIVPTGKWFLQNKKFDDVLGFDMAKLDCARFMVQECLTPTKHRTAAVIGADPASMK